jgi:FkbH-like protein
VGGGAQQESTFMFEFEANHRSFEAQDLPEGAQRKFGESRSTVKAFSLLQWEEHCTECAMPQCYKTCDLYDPRKDGKCRRFHDGFGYVANVPSILGYVTKISFKRWGQLMAYAHMNMVTAEKAIKLEHVLTGVSRIVSQIPDGPISIAGRSGISTRLMRRVKRWVATSESSKKDSSPDSFMIEVYNPSANAVNFSLVIRDTNGALRDRPFQKLIVIDSGFARFRIPYSTIAPHVDPSRQFDITLCPNLSDLQEPGVVLYFGLIGFVTEAVLKDGADSTLPPYAVGQLSSGEKYVKVVAWDLDNTLWNGVLVEDGKDKISLKPEIVAVIQELDRRGIVNSIVSKNDPASVLPILKNCGIEEYFVFPKISWQPKSQSVLELITAFNVSADSIAVIDDSAFERSEIQARCPQVRVFSDDQYQHILQFPVFRPPLSDESSRRRGFYRTEEVRVAQQQAFAGDYFQFLKQCGITIQVSRVSKGDINRVHELVQRTNQLNFSGNRYSRVDLETLLVQPDMLPLSIVCTDRFGDYGLVGFCLFDSMTSTVTDMMYSCRVQAKQIEHAFLIHLMQVLKAQGVRELRALYTKTSKNIQAAKVFSDLGYDLVEVDETTGQHVFAFDLRREIPQQDIISLISLEWRVA